MKTTLFILTIFIWQGASAQNAGITDTYVFNKLAINAATSCNNNKAKVLVISQLSDKNAIRGIHNNYVAIEMPISNKIGAAIQYSDFSLKLNKTKSFQIGLSKHFAVGDKATFSIGANGGISSTVMDFTSDFATSLLSQFESNPAASTSYDKTSGSFLSRGQFPSNDISQNQYLFGAGIYLNAEKWHLGFSVPNMIKNKTINFLDPTKEVVLERPAFLTVEKDFILSKQLTLKTGTLYRFSKLNPYTKGLDIQSSIWLKQKYSLGFWYQHIGSKIFNEPHPFMATTEVIFKKLRLGYSYNLRDNNKMASNIRQQIMFRIDIDYIKKKTNL